MGGAKRRGGGVSPTSGEGKKDTAAATEEARAANRIHCKETRDRRRERERLLGEEVEILQLCRSIVENGPDLFSLHKPTADAPFSYLCNNFFARLQLVPEQMIGMPLSSIVDDRDVLALRSAISQVLQQAQQHTTHYHHHHPPHQLQQQLSGGGGGGGGGGVGGVGGEGESSGSLIHLRLAFGLISCDASMSIVCGSHGLVVVTRLYNF